MMHMLVMGGGLQGSACAYDLLQNSAVERVRLADVRTGPLPPFLQPFADDPRLERVEIDARDPQQVRTAMSGMSTCLNALPWYFNLDITRAAIDAGVHCCDLGGNTGIVVSQIELDPDAREGGVSVIPDCGLAPGMVNILAAAAMATLDTTDSVRMFVGGLPQHPTPPLNYQIVYSLEGVLDYYTTPSWILRDGDRHQVDALSDVEPVNFDEPVGSLEAFHTAGGLSTLTSTWEGRVRLMEYKTLRYPGHADIMRAIRELGLLTTQPVDVNGLSVSPRDLFIACVEPRLRRPAGRDLVALRITAEGLRSGTRRRITWELVDFFDEEHGISAMERCTGYSLSITGQLQAAGQVGGPGVRTPDTAVPASLYIEALAARGVRIRHYDAAI
ncbi:MAG TPA: saccharopine dehydrogenase C-terminal domain-containing protein [Longimicrobiales bacterium]|nr:saccharopine dehydrogenase C-terminal domain-containing protein [Longimicrobiales bacterium]